MMTSDLASVLLVARPAPSMPVHCPMQGCLVLHRLIWQWQPTVASADGHRLPVAIQPGST
jgi:hypothetical protein